ncbi:Sec7 domain [Trypanosoma vivax]|uniref:SEC7 domain-containing protein n=1 Tax=Trypanosoma vivax (strain Y486) TaxID=1055687 RepID=G0U0B7_TRYVY|nr:hypothetical protein TRVL_00850 [Trypanosoma vivax]KAH8613981.1 Sec7 domain [Trypanosoma vivax]CCC49515.1 conserved hypothetical protein [Trypanosoma vivax Y486]
MQNREQKAVADVENLDAFLVQLRALLLQARQVARGNQKGRLPELLSGIDNWLKEVKQLVGQRRSISEDRADTASGVENQEQENERSKKEVNTCVSKNTSISDGQLCLTDTSHALEPAGAVSSSALRRPSTDPPSTSAVETTGGTDNAGITEQFGCDSTFSSSLGGNNIEDLAKFLSSLFISGVAESVPLRNVGRNSVRLVGIRSLSIIDNVLQRVVRELYNDSPKAGEKKLEDNEIPKNHSPVFTHLSHDITVATQAILVCLETLAGAPDFSSVRFAAQVSLDVLKQLRQSAINFEQSLFRREYEYLQSNADLSGHSGEDMKDVDVELAERCAKERSTALRSRLGPPFLNSITCLMRLVRHAIQYLVSIISQRVPAPSQEERMLKNDVSANLCVFPQWFSHATHSKQLQSESGGELNMSSSPEQTVSFVPVVEYVASIVVESVLPSSFFPEYISCIAQHCGDRNEGQHLAVHVLQDIVSLLVENNIRGLERLLKHARWRKNIVEGILGCILSVNPVVLDTGLDILKKIVVACPNYLGTEIGFLYTRGVFGLLESDSTPPAVRRSLLHHVNDTLLEVNDTKSEIPLLLHFYHCFDLNIHWHQLNVVQRAIATLSRAVRCATAEEFVDVDVPNKGATDAAATDGGTTARRSLPFLALKGLAAFVEILTQKIPQSSNLSCWRPLPRLLNREKKMDEQRTVEIINSSPIKGVRKLFNVTNEEFKTDSDAIMHEKNWSHKHLPSPSTPEIEEKVHRIAQFLLMTPSLNLEAVAEFLSYPAVLPLQVCQVFMDSLPLAGKTLVDGLKELLQVVQLPKEGQRIERLIEFFCSAYYKAGSIEYPDLDIFPFRSEESCFIAAIAVIMLNTNLHNPNVSSNKMTAATFHAQLRGCNEGTDFPHHFTSKIFEEISSHSLSSLQALWTGGGARQGAPSTLGKFDALFFSNDDRRSGENNAVRHRLASETIELIMRYSTLETTQDGQTDEFWMSITQDLFLSSWPMLSAAFGTAVQGEQMPESALLLYIKGLRSSLLVSAAFGLHNECGVSQAALLRLASIEQLRDLCHSCVLEIASSLHSVHFSSRCWMPVVELLIFVRKEQHQMQQQKRPILVEVESLFTRLEEVTREYCTVSVQEAPPVIAVAVRELLQGIATVLRDSNVDTASLGAALYVLRRALSYSLLSHDQQQGPVVTNFINVRDMCGIVVPALVDVVDMRREAGDDCLQSIMGFAVDVLSIVWNSSVRDGGSTQQVIEHRELMECFGFFQVCYVRCARSLPVHMHVLRGIKELVSRTVLAEGSVRARPHAIPSDELRTMTLIWQRLLQPVAFALSPKGSADTEACNLAIHVVRGLVSLSCGTVSSPATIQVRNDVLHVLLLKLMNLAFIGGLCGSVENAQMCLAQFPAISAAAVKQNGIRHTEKNCASKEEVGGKYEPNKPHLKLIEQILEGVQSRPNFVLFHLLERLCIMLRCHHQQTRAEVVTVLRTVVKQLKDEEYRQHLAVHVADAVLECSIGEAIVPDKEEATFREHLSFLLFEVSAPPTVHKCSPSAFRTTLSPLLNFVLHDFLLEAPPSCLSALAKVIITRCLLPLTVSPRTPAQTRLLAVRYFTQCADLCIATSLKHALDDERRACFSIVLDSIGFILFASHIPMRHVVPQSSDYCGRRWITEKSVQMAEYAAVGANALNALSSARAFEVTESRSYFTLCIDADEVKMKHSGIDEMKCSAAVAEDGEKIVGAMDAEQLDYPSANDRDSVAFSAVDDDTLVEYYTLMAQLLSPLPKMLSDMSNCVLDSDDCASQNPKILEAGNGVQYSENWAPPACNYRLVGELLLEAVGTLLCTLWRVNYAMEVGEFVAQPALKGRDASALNRGNVLGPHSGIRGGLNSYLTIVLHGDISCIRGVLVEILRATATVQAFCLGSRKNQRSTESVTDSVAVQQLSPQEQQLVRNYNMSMYQELTFVVSHWVKCLTFPAGATPLTTRESKRHAELAIVAHHAEVFMGLVRLLVNNAGNIITTIRDYLAWYIDVQQRVNGSQDRGDGYPTDGFHTSILTTIMQGVNERDGANE